MDLSHQHRALSLSE